MLTHTSRWSHARGNEMVPSRWQATPHDRAAERRYRSGIQEISEQLANATDRLETGRRFFLTALELLRDPQTFYAQGGSRLKRAMNKLIFTKLYVDGQEITGHDLTGAVSDGGLTRRLGPTGQPGPEPRLQTRTTPPWEQ